MISKESDERSTPLELFNPLDREFNLQLDVCATVENTKCKKFFTKEDKALIQKWAPNRCWMNPPYSNIPRWLSKALEEAANGALIVACLPTDSSTEWFHEYIWNKNRNDFRPGIKVRFPDRRYSFGDHTNSAKFATMIAIFTPHMEGHFFPQCLG